MATGFDEEINCLSQHTFTQNNITQLCIILDLSQILTFVDTVMCLIPLGFFFFLSVTVTAMDGVTRRHHQEYI